MNRIALVVKKAKQAAIEADRLDEWLCRRGLAVIRDEAQPYLGRESEDVALPSPAPAVDLAVVLGGDGTLLYAARMFGRRGIPLLGVNMGGLGFLTEISLGSLYPTIEMVLAGDFTAEERMMLEAEVIRRQNVVARHTVLNDAVINKQALARILDLQVMVDGLNLTNYRADGLIIATPTGSTAYNLAAGGPIVHPAHETIILTPICPFTLSNRPLVLPAQVIIEVKVAPDAFDVILTSDGQVSSHLEPEDTILVRRSNSRITLIKNPYKNYFEILRTKLGWG